MTGSFGFKGNKYIQLVKVLYFKLETISDELPTFPLKVQGLNRFWRRVYYNFFPGLEKSWKLTPCFEKFIKSHGN